MKSDDLSPTGIKLFAKLKEIWDHDDFVFGVLSFAHHDDDRQAVLDFIEKGEEVTTDTISLCALDLSIKRYGEQ